MNTPVRTQSTEAAAGNLLLRGSLITLRRRCGKRSCHCARGQPHSSPALSFSTKGKTRILTLTPDLLQEVRRALEQYRRQRRSLERQADTGLRQLARRLQKGRSTAYA